MVSEITVLPHSLARTAAAHLLPGIMAFFFYVAATRLGASAGLPPPLPLFLTMLLVLIPYELGVLVRAARSAGGGWLEVVPYRQPVPARYALVVVPLLLGWCFFCFFVLGPREERLLNEHLFAWPPAWLAASQSPASSKAAIVATWAVGLLVNGLAVPVVEELYFRGHLLPRIPCGRWSPLLNAALFSLYHFFSPWQNLTRTLAVAPIAYVVWGRRNVSLGIATHCLLNTIAMCMALPSLLK
jgi:membrane protease YdiL (CAAX protease family)